MLGISDFNARPVRNMFRNPGAINATAVGWWGGSAPNATPGGVQIVDAPWTASGKAIRVTWTTRTSPSGDVGLSFGSGDLPLILWLTGLGRRITTVFDLRSSHTFTVSSGVVGTVTPAGIAAPTVHGWGVSGPCGPTQTARFWITFTPTPGTTAINSIRAGVAALPLEAGAWAEWSNLDVYEGDYQPDRIFSHGNLPGFRWRGTAWLSETIGYPYTLESIAGRPLASLYRGTIAVNLPEPPAPDTPVTLYGAGARRGRTVLGITRLTDAANADPSLLLQESVANVGQAVAGFRSSAGITVYARVTDSVTDIPIVMCGQRRSATEGVLAVTNPGGIATATVLTSTWPTAVQTQLRHLGTDSQDQWDAVHLYRGAHDTDTRARIMAWLARRYNAPIPTGY